MVHKCAVRMCPNYKDKGVTFHYFPKDTKLSEIWAKKCQRLDLLDVDPKVRSGFCLCWRHFKPDDYSKSRNDTKKRRKLKSRVVPSLYLCANALITDENRTVDLESNNSASFVCVKFSAQKFIDPTCANPTDKRCETSLVDNEMLHLQSSVTKVPSNDESDVGRVNNKSHQFPQSNIYLSKQSNHFEQVNKLPANETMDECMQFADCRRNRSRSIKNWRRTRGTYHPN